MEVHHEGNLHTVTEVVVSGQVEEEAPGHLALLTVRHRDREPEEDDETLSSRLVT